MTPHESSPDAERTHRSDHRGRDPVDDTEAIDGLHEGIHSLLRTAFDGWGNRSYFDFKYPDFPGYDPRTHNFVVERDGRVVAARRVFPKQLCGLDGTPTTVHVHGGAAVHPAYRRRGLFTDLVEESREYSRNAGSPVAMTFNRRGKVSTEAHMRRDWDYRTIPLHVLALSPGVLIEEQAGTILPDLPGLRTAAVEAGTVAGDLLPDWLLARGVELLTSGTANRPFVKSTPKDSAGNEPTIRRYARTDADAVLALFDAELDRYDLAFERNPGQLRHMTGYERGTSLVALQDGAVTGFASAGLVDCGSRREARLFDVVGNREVTCDRLVDALVRWARRRDADAVSIVREERPGPAWASLRTDLVMWDHLGDGRREWDRLSNGDWRITAYDVL